MSLFKEILSDNNLEEPDGRPLYQIELTEKQFAMLSFEVKGHLGQNRVSDRTAALFVLWAAEYIRSNFSGGRLKWEFVFNGLGMQGNRNLGVDLIERGLRRWRREVRTSAQGSHLYLYSLMAEGGLPQFLLTRDGSSYSRIFKAIFTEIERFGGMAFDARLSYKIAEQRAEELPQSLQSSELSRLLAELAVVLVNLRSKVPSEIPDEEIDEWLDAHCPDWQKDLPLKLSDEIAAALIRPALRTERQNLKPIVARILRRRDNGNDTDWLPYVRLARTGYLPGSFLPQAAGSARLRLQVKGLDNTGRMIIYDAALADGGWELSSIGGAGIYALSLAHGLSLAAYDDGVLRGEAEILPPVPDPADFPCFWEEERHSGDSENDESAQPDYLSPLGGISETACSRIYLLAGEQEEPAVSADLHSSLPEAVIDEGNAAHYRLLPLSGSGAVKINGQQWQIKTNAERINRHIALIAEGAHLPYWRVAANGAAVFIGLPNLWGQRGDMPFQPVPKRQLFRKSDKRQFLTEITEWIENKKIIARLRYAALPEEAKLDLREIKAGELKLAACGLPEGTLLFLSAGGEPVRRRANEGGAELTLSVAGEVPGMVNLTLADPADGRHIELTAPWPARNAMLLSPDNMRLKHDCQVSLDALAGWRIIAPQSGKDELRIRIGKRIFITKIKGDRPLSVDAPLIRSMLSFAGADAEVRLNVISGGVFGQSLIIRRYDEQAKVTEDGNLLLGFTDERDAAQKDAVPMEGQAAISAVDLKNPKNHWQGDLAVNGPIDLKKLLPQEGQEWFIQASLNGKIQRAAVWFARGIPSGANTRDGRIAAYREFWRHLVTGGARRDWQMQWQIIYEVMQGGDAAALDQVQALAQEHEALVLLLLNAPRAEIPQVLSLDECAPFSWFCVNVECYKKALLRQYHCLMNLYKPRFDVQEATEIAAGTIAGQIKAALLKRPELAAHFGAALAAAELLGNMPRALIEKLVCPSSAEKMFELAQEAARRHGDLPDGIGDMGAEYKPAAFPQFNSYVQKLIDAPLAAAEITCGLKDMPSHDFMLTLIYLRELDRSYFDAMLPAAISYLIAEEAGNAEKFKTC